MLFVQAHPKCIAGLQSSLMGLNMHLDYVACCSATWLKVCLQPFQSGFLPGQCARKLVVKMLFGDLLIVRMFFVHRGRGNKVPNIVYVDIVQKLCFLRWCIELFFCLFSLSVKCCTS